MQNILIMALLAILDRIDIAAALSAILRRVGFYDALAGIYNRAKDEIPPNVLDRIEYLVRFVDDMDLPGEEKFKQVFAALIDSNSPVYGDVSTVPEYLLNWAIETAVARLRA